MRKNIRSYKTIIKAACLLQGLFMLSSAHAQSGGAAATFAVYISPNAVLYVNDKAQMSVMSNVINNGVFGTVKGVTVNLFGDTWRNLPNASFPDEWGINNINSFTGIGGAFRFANNNFPQYISGGYSATNKTGTSFPDFVVANPRGVYLDEDIHVRGTLHFENGVLWLNGNNILVGVSNPGSITGYSDTRFIGTGNTTKGGYLYRAAVSGVSGSVVFPVGTQVGSYAPLSIMFNTTKPQDLHVRVFDNIYRNAFLGSTGAPASVQQTWNIGQEDTAAVASIIALQHNATREGAAFTTHRGNSYISMYDFTLRTWDTLGPSGVITPGTFTTGAPLAATYINTRSLRAVGLNTYLTKNADTRTDSITLAKAALTPVREPDGSYRVTFVFLINNAGRIQAGSVQLFDTLSQVFKSPVTFSVTSVTASGILVPNTSYDGETITNLLMPSSSIAARRVDTVTLVLNVITNKKDGYYYNKASIAGIMNGFNGQYVFNNSSVNGFTAPAPGTAPASTPVTLSPSKYQIQEGISPNGDGKNDKFIIGSLGNGKAAIWVFSKYGTLVYKNMDYKNDWDGSVNQNLGGQATNQKVEDGTYYYKIIITDAVTGVQDTYYGFLSVWK